MGLTKISSLNGEYIFQRPWKTMPKFDNVSKIIFTQNIFKNKDGTLFLFFQNKVKNKVKTLFTLFFGKTLYLG